MYTCREARSECDGGNQTVSYKTAIPCSGGDAPESSDFVRTCTSFTLDDSTVYSLYAVVIGVASLILFLVVFVIIVHKKYTRAQEEAKYFKGQLTRHQTNEGDETVFEFADESNRVADTPLPSEKIDAHDDGIFDKDSDTDEEEDIDIKLCTGTKSDARRFSDDDGDEGEFTTGHKPNSPAVI